MNFSFREKVRAQPGPQGEYENINATPSEVEPKMKKKNKPVVLFLLSCFCGSFVMFCFQRLVARSNLKVSFVFPPLFSVVCCLDNQMNNIYYTVIILNVPEISGFHEQIVFFFFLVLKRGRIFWFWNFFFLCFSVWSILSWISPCLLCVLCVCVCVWCSKTK